MKLLEPPRPQRRPATEATPLRSAAIEIEAEDLEEAPIRIATLPRDHPGWQHDMLALSERACAILSEAVPTATVAILTFWDHFVRSVMLEDRRLLIDISGSYRLQ